MTPKANFDSYLMWIGAQHYPTIDAYCEEVAKQGASKRIPSIHFAAHLASGNAVIFLAHDEGEYEECAECTGVVENPNRRKLVEERKRVEAERDVLGERYKIVRKHDGDKGENEISRIQKLISSRIRKLTGLDKQLKTQDRFIDAGTGGSVKVDGKNWDYLRFNYWLHQPTKFIVEGREYSEKATEQMDEILKTVTPAKVTDEAPCAACGGKGRIPVGYVFGLIMPDQIEYILKEDDDETVRAEMEKRSIKVVETKVVKTEAKRGCGKRNPGGFYAVTTERENRPELKTLIEELAAKGVIDPETEVNGSFARFLAPVKLDGIKRFRGLKSYSLDPEAEDETQMIMEAMA